MTDKSWAHELVDNFSNSSIGGNIWLHLGGKRKAVAESLHARIDDPNKIDQLATNLCGVVSVVRDWAYDDPIDYAWLGIQLYETGRGRMGRGKMLGKIIAPSTDLKNSRVPESKYKSGGSKPMDPADWIILAPIREAFNTVLKYPGIWEEVSAINTPADVVEFFKKSGYTKIVSKTNWIEGDGYSNMMEASDLCDQGWKVVLLINSRLLYDNKATTQAVVATSDHWVGLLPSDGGSAISVNLFWRMNESTESDRIGISFKCHSWGDIVSVPNKGDFISFSEAFLKHYYGFIAAKY